MRFKVLGPLAVISADDRLLSIGGPKKRAALGYLLLHANEVVATSQLVEAVWPGDAPATARKMVQNTVSEIRRVLAEHDHGGVVALLTHSPGYLFRATEHTLDLLEFHHLAKSGRQALNNGSWAEASTLLGHARQLWRGDALADLADAGVNWPELAGLRETHRTTSEDYFEAELAAGRHHDQVAELDRLVSAQPHRERACRALMLALYRCGRQVDALDAYHRTRAVLTATFGVEPTTELRELEQAILRHDTTLIAPSPPLQLPPHPDIERKLVSILTVAFDNRPDTGELLGELGESGAMVVGNTGSSLQAVFGVPRTGELDAHTAVRSALAIHDRFTRHHPAVPLRLLVTTAETPVNLAPEPPEIIGSALDQSLRLARSLPAGQVWACAATCLGTGHDVVYTHHLPCSPNAPELWCVRGIPDGDPCGQRLLDRDHELAILSAHADQLAWLGRGRSVAVLGQAGLGKTRIVTEFARTIATHHNKIDQLTIRIPPRSQDNARKALQALAGRVTTRRPVVAVIEDLHHADENLLRLFDALAELARTVPLLLISTARPKPFGRDRLCPPASTTITLDRLSDKAVHALWHSVPGNTNAPLSPELARRIDGNPLFAVEFALHAVHESSATLPPRVYRALATELDGLPPTARQLLKSAALMPGSIKLEPLATTLGRDVDAVRDELDILVQQRLLRHTADRAGYEFAQLLLRDVVHAQLPKPPKYRAGSVDENPQLSSTGHGGVMGQDGRTPFYPAIGG
ncbi:MAG TPA: BTAD domain-containing putative transcriptional regulator [Pseudonocardiaceae bacterium]